MKQASARIPSEPLSVETGWYRWQGIVARPFGYRPTKRLGTVTREKWLKARRAARLATCDLRQGGLRYEAVGGFGLAKLNREHLVDNRGQVYFRHHSGALIPL